MTCTTCLAGSYMATPGGVACTACTLGQYQALRGATQCGPCGAGSAPSDPPPGGAVGSTGCDTCTPGRYAAAGASACAQCAAGRYAPAPNATVCEPCPTGTFASSPGSAQCGSCPAGLEATVTGSQVCCAPLDLCEALADPALPSPYDPAVGGCTNRANRPAGTLCRAADAAACQQEVVCSGLVASCALDRCAAGCMQLPCVCGGGGVG